MGLSRNRTPISVVFENLQDMSVEELVEEVDVTREQIKAVLDFVAQSLDTSVPEHTPSRQILILFDHRTPKGLVRDLSGHTIITAQSRIKRT
jgi:hypothetical protein